MFGIFKTHNISHGTGKEGDNPHSQPIPKDTAISSVVDSNSPLTKISTAKC